MDRKQLEAALKAIFGERFDYVTVWGSHTVRAALRGLDDAEELTFQEMCEVSELLQTKKIDIESTVGSSGCGTCGHGSRVDITLAVKDIGVELTV